MAEMTILGPGDSFESSPLPISSIIGVMMRPPTVEMTRKTAEVIWGKLLYIKYSTGIIPKFARFAASKGFCWRLRRPTDRRVRFYAGAAIVVPYTYTSNNNNNNNNMSHPPVQVDQQSVEASSQSTTPLSATSTDDVRRVTRMFAEQNLHDIPACRFQEMTSSERVAALQDLHGALDIAEETPELIETKLNELDAALEELEPEKRVALEEAMRRNAQYVQGLRLAFLRAEDFDAKKAAVRMTGHFTTRLSLFETPEVLGRDLRFSDFNDERDMLALNTGIIQLLPHRDRVGRPVIFMNPTAVGEEPFHFPSMVRALFWMTCLASKLGKDAQQRGFVGVCYGIGARQFAGRVGRGPRFVELFTVSAIKATSIHGCFDDPQMVQTFSEIAANAGSRLVARLQSHLGSHTACLGNLRSFGLPREILPISAEGKVHTAEKQKFIEQLQRQDLAMSDSDDGNSEYDETADDGDAPREELIDAPGPMDVVMGRGRRGVKLPGNVLLRRLQEEHYDAYNSMGSKVDKTCISQVILSGMRQAGCRFLVPVYEENGKMHRGRPVPKGWREVDDDSARDRIGHGFRNLRQANKG